MPTGESILRIDILDVSASPYAQRLCAATLQGLLNRNAPALFLDYGIYDDPNARARDLRDLLSQALDRFALADDRIFHTVTRGD